MAGVRHIGLLVTAVDGYCQPPVKRAEFISQATRGRGDYSSLVEVAVYNLPESQVSYNIRGALLGGTGHGGFLGIIGRENIKNKISVKINLLRCGFIKIDAFNGHNYGSFKPAYIF